MSEQVRAVIGLGANVGAPDATIARAIHALAGLPGATLVAVSRLYATLPVGVVDQPEFRNAVVTLDVPAGREPESGGVALLVALKTIERQFGRRGGRRWGPREIDLDLEAFGPHAIAVARPPAGRSVAGSTPGLPLLVVPHPMSRDRLFVLAPWADVAPDQRPPGWQETVAEARDRRARDEPPGAVRPVARWDMDEGGWIAEAGSGDSPAART